MSEEQNKVDEVKPEIEEPEDVKAFFATLKKSEEYLATKRAATREEALANVPKFRLATADYLKAISEMKLPECYVKTLAAYIEALNLYELEGYACAECNFRVGAIRAFIVPRTQENVEAQKTNLEAAASEEKKVNVYAGPEKTAEQVTAAKKEFLAKEDKKVHEK